MSPALTFEVGAMSDANNPNTFFLIQTISTSVPNYQQYVVSLDNVPASHKFIAFRQTTVNSENTYLDDIDVNNNFCIAPTGLQISNVNYESASLSWTPVSTETEWDIALSQIALTNPTNANTITNTFT